MMKTYSHLKSVSSISELLKFMQYFMELKGTTDLFILCLPTIFCATGVPFPRNFLSIAKTILKRLFRVYAHIYHQHFPEVVQLGEEAHLNTSFKHFIYFVQVNSPLNQTRSSHDNSMFVSAGI